MDFRLVLDLSNNEMDHILYIIRKIISCRICFEKNIQFDRE